jgi:hypothetical protein
MIASTDGANIEIAEEVCNICALPDLLTNNLKPQVGESNVCKLWHVVIFWSNGIHIIILVFFGHLTP